MKGLARWVVIGAMFVIGVCAVVVHSDAVLGDGGTTVLDGLVVQENTTLADGTWFIKGNALILNGTLTVDNATVEFDSSSISYLTVMANASWVCRNSTITGKLLYSAYLRGPSEFINCTLGDEMASTTVTIIGTTSRMEHCTVKHWELVVQGTLEAFNCSFFGGDDITGGHRNNPASMDYRIIVVDCDFSSLPGSGYSVLLRGPDDVNLSCCTTFRRCLFDPCSRGFDIGFFEYNGSVIIEDCTISAYATGINLASVGRVVRLDNCSISATIGVAITGVSYFGPIISNLTIAATTLGITVSTCPFNFTIWDVNVTSDSAGLTGYNANLIILHSWIEGDVVDLSLHGFTTVLLIDCVNVKTVRCADSSKLTAKRKVGIPRVKWSGGPDIIDGITELFTVYNRYTGTVNNAQPQPVPLQYFFINTTYSERSDKVFARHARDGLVFYSGLYPMMNVSSIVPEIRDDSPPVLTVETPRPGSIFNSTSIDVTGSVVDKGSGISHVRARCDSGEWCNALLRGDGTFDVTVNVTEEGDHVIEVTARDKGGNADDAWIGGVLTDLTPPFILVDGPDHYTNQSRALLLIRTEKLSRAYLNDVPVEVDTRGLIAVWLDLVEGVTNYMIRVIDRAGNVNETSYDIELDTSPPMLIVDHPVQGGWVNTTSIILEGVTEADAKVLIDHEPAERNGVVFSRAFEVTDGERSVLVEAWDRAGNGARLVLTFTVDTQVPTLTVETPLSGAWSNTSVVTVSGRAWDEFHVELTVGGAAATVSGGWWTTSMELDEGWNEVRVVARDLAGNTARVMVTILVDTSPPRATVRLVIDDVEYLDPSTDVATARTEAVIRLYTEEACNVTVAGLGTWSVPTGTSEIGISLEENTVNVVEVVPVDRVGNTGDVVTFRILVDTLAPPLDIVHPLDGALVATPFILLNGTTEPGAFVRIQGKQLILSENGTFSAELVLYEGVNSFEVEALDPVGNRANLTLTILFEPPTEGGDGGDQTPGGWVAWALVIAAGVVIATLVLRRRASARP